ncbi:MAG: DNAase, partial [Mycobacterium sp.]
MSSHGRRSGPPPIPEPLAPLIDAHTHLDACGARTVDDVHAILD